MKASFKGVTESTGQDEVVPGAQYPMVCVDYREDINKSDNTPVIELDWSVIEGEHEGHTTTDKLFFTPKAIRRSKAVCKRLQIKKNLDEDVDLERSDFVSKKALITLEVETFKDRTGKDRQKNRVAYLGYNEEAAPPSGGNGSAKPTAPVTGAPTKSTPLDEDGAPF